LKQSWPISFYWKAHTVSLIRRCMNILLVEYDLHNGKSLFVPLAKLGFPINAKFRIKSIFIFDSRWCLKDFKRVLISMNSKEILFYRELDNIFWRTLAFYYVDYSSELKWKQYAVKRLSNAQTNDVLVQKYSNLLFKIGLLQ